MLRQHAIKYTPFWRFCVFKCVLLGGRLCSNRARRLCTRQRGIVVCGTTRGTAHQKKISCCGVPNIRTHMHTYARAQHTTSVYTHNTHTPQVQFCIHREMGTESSHHMHGMGPGEALEAYISHRRISPSMRGMFFLCV